MPGINGGVVPRHALDYINRLYSLSIETRGRLVLEPPEQKYIP